MTDESGATVTLGTTEADGRVAPAGAVWNVTLAPDSVTGQALLLELADGGQESAADAGVEVQVRVAGTKWATGAHLRP